MVGATLVQCTVSELLLFFRMGIDRNNVRLVCHFNTPKSMESFYQESGRAGRDGLPSRSLTYYGMDDCRKMEFILRSAASKKSESSLQGDMSKKSLTDFKQIVDYCEGSECRRKKILESFGEQVPASLCGKSCDACKDPNLVSKKLEELASACTVRQINGFSKILTSSPRVMNSDEKFSEFWNREDEISGSEEDISDSDDGEEAAKHMVRSKLPSKSSISEKIELLQKAEEDYNQNRRPEKQVNRVDKNVISETLRESSQQRLLSALMQTKERLSDQKIDLETSSTFLENECYKKYGKAGKTFYFSQVASTVRWLSTTNLDDLKGRLQINSNSHADILVNKPLTTSTLVDHKPPNEVCVEEVNGSGCSTIVISDSPEQCSSQSVKLPTIPSFSEFVNSKKAKETRSNHSSQFPKSIQSNCDKKTRLQ